MCVRGHICVLEVMYMCVRVGAVMYICVRGHVYMCVRGHIYVLEVIYMC